MENKDGFSYSYSAKEQEEIKRIRNKYLAPEEESMQKLIKLDRSVSTKATVWSVIVGIIGALIMGTGMSLAMTTGFATVLNIEEFAMPIGIVIGLLGIGISACAYHVYKLIAKAQRKKVAPEIIRITDSLIK